MRNAPTPLGDERVRVAIATNDVDALSLLLSRADLLTKKFVAGAGGQPSALMVAAEHAHPDCVRLLLPFSSPLARDAEGVTALMKAARGKPLFGTRFTGAEGEEECVRLLLPESDALAADKRGMTSLMHAAFAGRAESLRLLLPHSAPYARDADGAVAMGWAVEAQQSAVADLLAPLSPREDVERAFKAFGKSGMPGWAAKLEAGELAEAAGLANGSDAVVAARARGNPARL